MLDYCCKFHLSCGLTIQENVKTMGVPENIVQLTGGSLYIEGP